MAVRYYELMSDAGGIVIGTKEAYTRISSGRVGGFTGLIVADSMEEAVNELGGEPYDYGWKFWTTVEGTRIKVPYYDSPGVCGEWDPAVILSGCYDAWFRTAYDCEDDQAGIDANVLFVRTGDAPDLEAPPVRSVVVESLDYEDLVAADEGFGLLPKLSGEDVDEVLRRTCKAYQRWIDESGALAELVDAEYRALLTEKGLL